MAQLFALAIVLLLLTPDLALTRGGRGGRGMMGGIGTLGRFGSSATIRSNFGAAPRFFSTNRIFIPHSRALGFHPHGRPFPLFTVVSPAFFYPPVIYYNDFYYPSYMGGNYSNPLGPLIIDVPPPSGSIGTDFPAPELPAQPFAPAPLLGGSPVRTVPGQLAPFDPTPQEVVERMLALAGVRSGDVVYDLGCGDGRVIITAAKKYGVKAVGFELDPGLVKLAREKIKNEKLEKLVEVRQQDFMIADLYSATVVTLYLSYDGNQALKPILMKQLHPGTRVVSYTFDMGDWTPNIAETYRDAAGDSHALYLWEIPAAARYGDTQH